MPDDAVTMDKIVALCKRRGLILPASEIYGGIANTYDYGHYGVLLKRNVVDAWWQAMIGDRDDIVALDSAIIQHPRTWEASGHLAGFTDPLVDCRTCKQRFRADHLDAEHDVRCPRKPSSSTSRRSWASRGASRRSASPRSASRSATRSRLATSSSARSSSSRWRWSTSSRPRTPSSGTANGCRRGWTGTRGWASAATTSASART